MSQAVIIIVVTAAALILTRYRRICVIFVLGVDARRSPEDPLCGAAHNVRVLAVAKHAYT